MNGLLFIFSDIISTVNTVVSIINIVFIVLLILSMLLGFARGIFKSTFWFAVTVITFVGGWFLLPSVTAKLFEINLAQFIGTNAHFADETVAEYIQVLVANTLYGDYIIVGDAVCTVDAAIVSEMITYQLVIALYFELSEGYPLGEFMRAVRNMELEMFDIRMESDGALSDGSSAFIATVKSKHRREHTGILSKLGKLEGVVYLEEV